MPMCMRVCPCACVYARLHVCIPVCMHVCPCACVYARVHVCIPMCMRVCPRACVYARVHACMPMCMCVCACAWVCACACDTFASKCVCLGVCKRVDRHRLTHHECVHVHVCADQYSMNSSRVYALTHPHVRQTTYHEFAPALSHNRPEPELLLSSKKLLVRRGKAIEVACDWDSTLARLGCAHRTACSTCAFMYVYLSVCLSVCLSLSQYACLNFVTIVLYEGLFQSN